MANNYGIGGRSTEDDDFANNPPPRSLVQNAAAQNPLGAAAATAITPGSSLSPGAYGQQQGQADANRINSGYYGNQVQTSTPNAWYGKGNEYGMSMMAGDSGNFWAGYGDNAKGWGPTSDTSAWYANKYDTQALGASLFGKEAWTSDEGRMAGQSAIADAITKPGVQFFDPGQIIGNVMQALSSRDTDALANVNPMLAQLLQSQQGNPAGQVDSILGFLAQALSASMPQDALQAFIGQLQAVGQEFTAELIKSPRMKTNANFAEYLVHRFGPTLGL